MQMTTQEEHEVGERPGLRERPTLKLSRARRDESVSMPSILVEGMAAAEARARAVDVGAHEARDADLAALCASIEAILKDALTAAQLAFATYDEDVPAADAREDAARGWPIAGVAFVARLQLGRHAQRVASLRPDGARLDALGACDAARRAALKSLRALSRAIRVAERLPVDDTADASEVARSLRTRRAYTRFHAELVRDAPGSLFGARIRLRCGVSAVDLLLRGVGALMRIEDRRALHAITTRGAACLRASQRSDEGSREAAAAICEELANVTELMLAGINHREDLIRHDRRALRCAAIALGVGDGESMLRFVRQLEGRSRQLDGLARAPELVGADAWERAIAGARAALSTARSSGRLPAARVPA